jgi:hypothetical protein
MLSPHWPTSNSSSTVNTDSQPLVPIRSNPTSQSQSHIAIDAQSVSQSVLVSIPIWDPWPDIYYCLTVTVLLLWGALSDERTGLSFVRVIVCISKSFVRIFTFYMLNMLINVYKIYTGPLSVQAQYSRLCPISSSFRYNGSLITWTVISLTATKFMFLILSNPKAEKSRAEQ